MVDRIKAIKRDEEIGLIKRTTALQDEAIAYAKKAIRPGRRDFEIIADIVHKVTDLGSEEQLVIGGSGPLGKPVPMQKRHFQNRTVREGDQFTLMIEVNGPGGMYGEIGRVFFLGKVPSELYDANELCKETQKVTLKLLKPGADPADIWRANNEAILPSDLAPSQIVAGIMAPGSTQVEPPLCLVNDPFNPTTPELFAISRPYYDPAQANSFTIDAQGFGTGAGMVLLDGVTQMTVNTWSTTQITFSVPAGTTPGPHQLSIQALNGETTVNGLTFHVLGGLPFPQTPVVDNFDRANGTLGANWGTPPTGTFRIDGNNVQVRATGSMYWQPGLFGANPWAHFMDMHWPYHLGGISMKPREIALEWQDLAIMHGRSNFNRNKPFDDQQKERFIGLYQQSLQYLDRHLGRLLSRLAEMGHGEDSLVVLASDHGEEFLEHGRWGHWESNLFDEILKVPLIIRLPHQPRKLVIKQQVRNLDLMPTILDICNCPIPTNLMGVSMSPFWSNGGSNYTAEVSISEMRRDPWHRIALRTENYKFISDSKRPDQPDLYNLKADPGEKRNVSQNYPQEIIKFRSLIDEHLQRVAATEPLTAIPQLEYDKQVEQRLRDLGYL